MKKIFLTSVVALALCSLSSCGFSRQASINQNLAHTEVVLAKKNYRVLGSVTGESSQNYVLGIGGLSKKSLHNAALADMYKNADLLGLGKAGAVINVSVVYKTQFIIIYNQVKCIATGTVIEFID